MILGLLDEAVRAGARLKLACETIGLSVRAIQRWRKQGGGGDRRCGPHSEPPNKLSAAERQEVLEVLSSPQYRDLSPNQIVPRLADEGSYIASEATMYRILREEALLAHREPSRPAVVWRTQEHLATGPNQVWSWDITYLRTPVRGSFFYLYLILDVWSRKIMGARVFREESMDLAAELFEQTCQRHHLDPDGIVLHSDNGGPMKGSTMLATLKRLGVVASFSRPRVSDDNPYSEAMFRTLKYRPEYPSGPFASLEAAHLWVACFVRWYNEEHRHSAIRFVTPEDRHSRRETEILERRQRVYERARRRHPRRWSGATRNWDPIETDVLNPEKETGETGLAEAA
ncbi:MAG: IS3 family transposase [bacterium]|nr:IS3 family transposase [bacterium]